MADHQFVRVLEPLTDAESGRSAGQSLIGSPVAPPKKEFGKRLARTGGETAYVRPMTERQIALVVPHAPLESSPRSG